ncbi:N-methyl-D-aspartate receptor NMDAR2C subunit [Comamonas sp. GB3 AK4-5]|uniref:HD domain-containing protein n=1 Tax=Comamonas sp. GB3 AK4-5 TaxID=3231487 RepID=UPI00351E8AD4
MLTQSWQRSWAALGMPAPQAVLDSLLAAYQEGQRSYHTLQHVQEMIALLEPLLGQAQHPGELELALWFHDAVYQPRAKDNELQSAHWAARVMQQQGLGEAAVQRVHALIMATCHAALPQQYDAQLLVDIDLGILAADAARFAEYEQQIRAEYLWVPSWIYRSKRRAVLQSFMDRECIYSTPVFSARFEAAARRNLEQALHTR